MLQRRLVDWIEHRTGLETAVKNFLFEEIPASSGSHQVFGSVAVFLFLVQAFTGLLLAFNYAPTPGDAYNSLKYIVTELTGGALMRGLHHWGASMMIVVVVLHMTQVFLYGASKKPREVRNCFAAFDPGLRTHRIPAAMGQPSLLGDGGYDADCQQAAVAGSLRDATGGEDSIGVVTFARFFALHVLLLPPVTTFLIAFHIYLVRKHGVAPAPGDTRPPKKFFPDQVFKDTLAIFAAFIILFVLAVVAKVPLERLADPTDTTYIPRPDWYFLFLFQILKFFEGPLEIAGSIVLPTMAIVALFLVPFLDGGVAKRLAQRTVAFSFIALVAIGWTGLTVTAIVNTPEPATGSAREWNGGGRMAAAITRSFGGNRLQPQGAMQQLS